MPGPEPAVSGWEHAQRPPRWSIRAYACPGTDGKPCVRPGGLQPFTLEGNAGTEGVVGWVLAMPTDESWYTHRRCARLVRAGPPG